MNKPEFGKSEICSIAMALVAAIVFVSMLAYCILETDKVHAFSECVKATMNPEDCNKAVQGLK
jgi:hypothetical protein